MQWDQEKQASRIKEQEEVLREYLVHHIYPYSPYYRRTFDAAKLAPKHISAMKDLAKVTPVTWSDVAAEPGAFLLRPTERAIARFGERKLVMAIAKAKLRGRQAQVNREVIDPAYKPVHWHTEGDVPIGYSSEDLKRLGEAGRRVLTLAEVTRDDVLVGLANPEPCLPYWQVVEGARTGGVSALHLPAATAAERLGRLPTWSPTVLAGPPGVLGHALSALASGGRRLNGLRTLLALGVALDNTERAALRSLGRSVGEGDLEVVAAWAPPGVRALWGECRGGHGFHTYPDLEWLDTDDGGELIWTSLAWHGSVFLRLRTGATGVVEDTTCPTCGRTGPKLLLSGLAPPARVPAAGADDDVADIVLSEPAEPDVLIAGRSGLAEVGGRLRVLDEHPAVAAWQAEYRRVEGAEELIVFVAPTRVDRLGPLFRELDATLSATQFVVMRPEQVHERVSRQGAVVDLRSP
ncbi:MAG: hypothetical protein ACRDY7_18645 [Acidimicrobiia bacterium]